MSTIEIRLAEAKDLPSIVAVFLECWRVSYAEVLPAEVLDRMDQGSALELWTAVLTRPGIILIAESGGEALGLARYAVTGDAGYLASLYVSPRSQGSGLGSRLLEVAEFAIRDSGAADATLWVFAANEPSIAFYRGRGWLPTGAQRVEKEFGAPEAQFAKTLR